MRRPHVPLEHRPRAGRAQPLALAFAVLLAAAAVWGWQTSTTRGASPDGAIAPIADVTPNGAVDLGAQEDYSLGLDDVQARAVQEEASAPDLEEATVPTAEEPGERVPIAAPPALAASAPVLPVEEEEPTPAGIHSIHGVLVSDSGAFRSSASALVRGLHLDLVGRDSPDVRQAAQLKPITNEEGALLRIEFSFDELPSEEFELTLSSLDAQEWYPKSMLVIAPAEDVEFRCLDRQETVALQFNVVDAATKEPIADWTARQFRSSVSAENGVLMHAGPLDLAAFPVTSSLAWIVEAPGYAPAMGTELSFREDPDTGDWTARVELTKGYRVRLVVLAPNPELRPAAGAQVFLDGKSAGVTDGDGQLIIDASAAPTIAKVTWRDLSAEGPFEDICMERPHALVVTVLR